MLNSLCNQWNANKLLWDFILYMSEWSKSIKQRINHTDEDVEWREYSSIAGANVNFYNYYRNWCGGTQEPGNRYIHNVQLYHSWPHTQKWFILQQTHVINHVHCHSLYNIQKLVIAWMSINGWIDKEDMVQLDNK